jgi:uncharacterized protein YxjI
MSYTLELRQRVTPLQNRFDIVRLDGPSETSLAFAEQKRFKLRESITFYADDSRSTPTFTLGARNIVELVGTYDVTDATGRVLGTLAKDAGASLLRSTYRVETPGQVLVGSERGQGRALARRVFSVAGDLPWALPLHFDFRNADGGLAFAVERQFRFRDAYEVTVHDGGVDWRLAAACGVAVDVMMNR